MGNVLSDEHLYTSMQAVRNTCMAFRRHDFDPNIVFGFMGRESFARDLGFYFTFFIMGWTFHFF